ncbi:hypothetical protein K438DRAFT_1845025 [Mycena galopus ATCC 62051]|nr:hypothetical protein K438DRAFT_1845025 [Mycena galopus ATCC 62051]
MDHHGMDMRRIVCVPNTSRRLRPENPRCMRCAIRSGRRCCCLRDSSHLVRRACPHLVPPHHGSRLRCRRVL